MKTLGTRILWVVRAPISTIPNFFRWLGHSNYPTWWAPRLTVDFGDFEFEISTKFLL